MAEKITVLIASVKEREEQLKTVLSRIYNNVDEIHLILNFYEKIPKWVTDKSKIVPHLNVQNKNAHDAIWSFVPKDGYVFILDDDLFYPQDYFDKLIATIEHHERRAVITAHGSNIIRPVEDYFGCRAVYGFSDRIERDLFMHMVGCGCTAFHASTIQPILQDFPIPYCRDLWFSILCAKNKVKIITPQRSQGWILPLKTPGDSVYEVTKRSKNLQQVKNRILKETFLPLLFCNQDINNYCLITDYDFDERLVNKCLETLTQTTADQVNKIIFNDKLNRRPGTLTQFVTPEERAIGRAGSKIITHFRFINGLPNGSKVISADADLYFLKDPFEAFNQDFDIAVTTRPEKYHYPINQGVVMFRVNDRVRDFLNFLAGQIFERTWPELIQWQMKFDHVGNDWCIGQDIMCVAWLCRAEILNQFGVTIKDIGSYYNFCPHADGEATEEGKRILMDAYDERKVAVLHLKSRLKELLFEGDLP